MLLLTARGQLSEKVEGLNAGADDYLPKPFEIEELVARVRALGRRGNETKAGDRRLASLEIFEADRFFGRCAGRTTLMGLASIARFSSCSPHLLAVPIAAVATRCGDDCLVLIFRSGVFAARPMEFRAAPSSR